MDVKVYGYELIPCEGVTLDELWEEAKNYSQRQLAALQDYLENDADKLPPILSDNRLIVIQDYDKGQYKSGLILKIRDAKSMFRVVDQDGEITLSAVDFDPGERQAEINFFLLRPESGKGLYAYYYQSTHMNNFCRTFKDIHDQIVKRKYNGLKADLENDIISKGEFKKQKRMLGSFTYSIMAYGKQAHELIDDLDSIKKVKLCFTDWDDQTKGEMAPLVMNAKRTYVEMSFDPNATPFSRVKRYLIGMVTDGTKLKRMRVEGTDPDKLNQVINLENNLEFFAKEDYKKLASSISEVNLSDLATSWKKSKVLKWLKKCAESKLVKNRLK